MTQEEKAKAYDEALERAKRMFTEKELNYLFPELAESEDERIRGAIIDHLKDNNLTEWAAWLKKQGEPMEINPTEFDTRLQTLIGKFDNLPKEELIGSLSFWLNVVQNDGTYKDEEKQGEQKPTDKAESKFHEGDWVVISTSDGEKVVQIDSIEYFKSGEPRYITSEGRWFGNGTKAHLWTIQDAKDGDVLFQDLMCGKTFIYNGVNPDMAILYSFIISNDGKNVLPYHIGKPNTGIGNIEENKNIIHPATKKQCDLLFQKMHEAGYEWDAEKKELRRIEQKPTALSEKVDLEKELNIWRHNHFHGRRDKEASGEYLKRNSQLDIAKHFFELGLKTKGE